MKLKFFGYTVALFEVEKPSFDEVFDEAAKASSFFENQGNRPELYLQGKDGSVVDTQFDKSKAQKAIEENPDNFIS